MGKSRQLKNTGVSWGGAIPAAKPSLIHFMED